MASDLVHGERPETISDLKRREGVLDSIVDTIHAGTWEYDIAKCTLNNNHHWMRILGLEPEEHDGSVQVFIDRLHPDDADTVLASIGRVISGEDGDVYRSTHRMIRKVDGAVLWVKDSGRVIERNAEGRALSIVGAVIDITEQHLEALRQAEDARQARSANDAKSRFVAHMAHEIRTPLNGILGLSQVLRDSLSPDDRESQSLVGDILRSGDTLLGILNDVLDLSKIEAGQLELRCEPFLLDDLVEPVISLFSPIAAEKGISLVRTQPAPLTRALVGDRLRLRQILFNLVGNACKFTDQGEVKLDITHETDCAGDCSLVIGVHDTGPGIPMHKQQRLFHPFQQVDDSATRQMGGTGLGLAICRSLVEAMDGTIGVVSMEGEGSLFWFRITLPTKEWVTTDTSTKADLPVRPLKILLAEDVVINQRVALALLAQGQHAVTVANDGQEAVDIARGERFDLIMMDINMPRLDGYGATEAIRADANNPNQDTPILAVTATVFAEEQQKMLEAGMNDILAKPFKKDALVESLHKWQDSRIIPA